MTIAEAIATQVSRVTEMRRELLCMTLEHAIAHSSFYRERLGGTAYLESASDLRHLPLLTKFDLQNHAVELRTSTRFPDVIMYTSGTTGRPLEVPVIREEIAAGDILVLLWRCRLGAEPPLNITIIRVGHGLHVLTPSVPSLPCHINYDLNQLLEMLCSEHYVDGHWKRATNLEANVLNVREITYEMLRAGIDPRSFGLDTISISGWYLPPVERRALESIWGVTLLDRYGVTEVNGDAKWCAICERYHFDCTVIPEVLDLCTGEPIDEGIGRMVITGLYPFNQMIPKIRYVTGDLVDIAPSSCGSAEPAILFLSRESDAVWLSERGRSGRAIFPTHIVDALAAVPDVARTPKTGFLKFRLSGSDGPHVEIELNYPPDAFRTRVEELRIALTDQLLERIGESPRWTFAGPNSLSVIHKV